MTCVVFTNNREKAKAKLEEIKNIKGNLVRLYKTRDRLEYDFEDGDSWRWERINATRRGIRAFKAYIDKNATIEELEYIVLPSCSHCEDEDVFYF